MPLPPNTERYLRRNGVSADVIQDLNDGKVATVTAESFASWIKGAFKDGQQHTRRSLAEALMPQIEKLVEAAYVRGAADTHAELHPQIMQAEKHADEFGERLDAMKALETRHAAFHAIVADCQQWFNGFAAAHAGRESWDKPRVPDPETLRDLNIALQRVGGVADEEIPF